MNCRPSLSDSTRSVGLPYSSASGLPWAVVMAFSAAHGFSSQSRSHSLGFQRSGSMERLLLVVVGWRGAEHVRPQQMPGNARRRLDGEDMLSGDLAALAPVADDVLGNANGGCELSDAASYFDCLG